MDLRRLQHFIALADSGRFTAAAEHVHLSPAAFTRSIQALEAEAGLPLLDRGPQGITLTSAGQLLLQRARKLVFDSSSLQRDLALLRSGDAGELVIGAGPVAAATVLPALLAALREQCPQLVCRVRIGKLPQLLAALDAQELDLCIGDPRQLPPDDRHALRRIGRQYGGLYCRRGHPLLRRGARVDAAALRHYGLALISTAPALGDLLARTYGFGSGSELPVRLECDNIALLARLLADTDTLGLLPDAVATPLRLQRIDKAGTAFADLHVIWLQARTLAPVAGRAIALAETLGAAAESASEKP